MSEDKLNNEVELVEGLDIPKVNSDTAEDAGIDVLREDSKAVRPANEGVHGSYQQNGKPAKPRGGAHANQAQSAFIQKSSRMRKILIVVIVLLVLLLVAIGVFGFQIFQTAKNTATQQTSISQTDSIDTEVSPNDASATVPKKSTVPNLVSLLGKKQEEAVTELAHGAQLISSTPINEEGNPVKFEVKIALTEEPADTRTGTPTVFLSELEDTTIVRDGYSVSTSSLGYGSLSFSDLVEQNNVIEKTLEEAGLTVSYGSVKLPEDKSVYSTYDSDGTTLIKEYCSFEGTGIANGVEHPWEAVLSYDYSMAVATGNLSDTIRTIFVYISQ